MEGVWSGNGAATEEAHMTKLALTIAESAKDDVRLMSPHVWTAMATKLANSNVTRNDENIVVVADGYEATLTASPRNRTVTLQHVRRVEPPNPQP
jgi:hypothetical protein